MLSPQKGNDHYCDVVEVLANAIVMIISQYIQSETKVGL